MTTDTERLEQVFNKVIRDNPHLFGRFDTQSPAYRYFWHKRRQGDQYFWTTERVNHNGKPRYASGIYRYIKTQKHYKLTNERYHVKRKDAKARARELWENKV